MNEDLIRLVDLIGRAFWQRLAAEPDKKGLLVLMGIGGFNIPNPRFDKPGWDFFCHMMRERHSIDAFFNQGEDDDHTLLYERGTIETPPTLSEEQVDAIKCNTKANEKLAEAEFQKLMKKIAGH